MTIALKYVQRQANYHYFRFPGAKRVRLEGMPGSPEYMAQYELLLASTRPVDKPAIVPARIGFLPSSVGWVIERFLASKKFTGKAAGTQVAYRRVLDLIKREIGGCDIADMRRSHVKRMTADIAAAHTASVADMALRLTSALWKFARDLPDCKIDDDTANPARDIEARYQVEQEHLPWPASVQHKFLDGAPADMRLAFALALYTGQRRGDICKMKWADIDAKGVLHVTQEKTGAHVPMRLHRELVKILATTPRKGEYILTSRSGKRCPIALTHAIQRRLRAVGCGDQYALHGLRKTAATMLAEAGATETELMRVFGWATSKQATYYTRKASARTIVDNAMIKWEQADQREAA
jgi:integrase